MVYRGADMTSISRRVRSAAIVAAALSLGGCAIFNPYVGPSQASGAAASRSRITEGVYAKSDTELLRAARDYADRMDVGYRSAARQHAMTKTWLAFSTTGLAGFSAFRQAAGQTNGGNDLVPAVALFNATAIQWADLLLSSPRQGAYMVGSNAVLCAKRRTDPYEIRAEDEEALTGPELSRLAAAIEGSIAAVTAAKPGLNDTLQKEADSLVAAADAERDQAAAVISQGDEYRARRRMAALGLIATVDKIGNEIDVEVLKTEVSVAAIRAAMNNPAFQPPAPPAGDKKGTGGAQGGVVVVGEGLPRAGGGSSVRPAAFDTLRDATYHLRYYRQIRERLMRRLTAAEAASGADQCRVAGIAPLSVEAPTGLLAIPGDLRITIHGSEILPPSATVDGDAKGITSEIVVQGSGNYQAHLMAAAGVAAGKRNLVVVSGDKAETKTVPFDVGTATKEPAPGATPGPSTAGTPAWITKENRYGDVLAFGATMTPVDWKVVLNNYAKVHRLLVGAGADGAPIPEAAKVMDAAVQIAAKSDGGALNAFELWWADDVNIKALQKKLGVAQTGLLDKATRAAIVKAAAKAKLDGSKGLTPALLAKIAA